MKNNPKVKPVETVLAPLTAQATIQMHDAMIAHRDLFNPESPDYEYWDRLFTQFEHFSRNLATNYTKENFTKVGDYKNE